MSSISKPEPWLRGELSGIHPVVAAVCHAFQQAREDLERWTSDLTDDELWRAEGDIAPVGFHIRHIGGSVDRLMTYASGRQLNAEQMSSLRRESEPGPGRAELLADMDRSLRLAEAAMRELDVSQLDAAREVGRSRLPTTVVGLLIHVAEHTQRHVGEAIVTSKVVRARRRPAR